MSAATVLWSRRSVLWTGLGALSGTLLLSGAGATREAARGSSHAAVWIPLGGKSRRASCSTLAIKWQAMLARHAAEEKAAWSAPASVAGEMEWRRLCDSIRLHSGYALLERVNRAVNNVEYRFDRQAHGRNEYWATPREFLTRGGDCEDFAIAKFLLLAEAGVPSADRRVMVVIDKRNNAAHAVTSMRHADQAWILDILDSQPIKGPKAKHYWPVLSMNEKECWLHT